MKSEVQQFFLVREERQVLCPASIEDPPSKGLLWKGNKVSVLGKLSNQRGTTWNHLARNRWRYVLFLIININNCVCIGIRRMYPGTSVDLVLPEPSPPKHWTHPHYQHGLWFSTMAIYDQIVCGQMYLSFSKLTRNILSKHWNTRTTCNRPIGWGQTILDTYIWPSKVKRDRKHSTFARFFFLRSSNSLRAVLLWLFRVGFEKCALTNTLLRTIIC